MKAIAASQTIALTGGTQTITLYTVPAQLGANPEVPSFSLLGLDLDSDSATAVNVAVLVNGVQVMAANVAKGARVGRDFATGAPAGVALPGQTVQVSLPSGTSTNIMASIRGTLNYDIVH